MARSERIQRPGHDIDHRRGKQPTTTARNGSTKCSRLCGEGNIDFVIDFAARRIPSLKVIRPQASFLLWLDFRGLHLCHREVMDMLLDKAHLALNDGTMFGAQGDGFARLNAGTPRAVLPCPRKPRNSRVHRVQTIIMDYRITPPKKFLKPRRPCPAAKSIITRAMVMAAIASKTYTGLLPKYATTRPHSPAYYRAPAGHYRHRLRQVPPCASSARYVPQPKAPTACLQARSACSGGLHILAGRNPALAWC